MDVESNGEGGLVGAVCVYMHVYVSGEMWKLELQRQMMVVFCIENV